MPMHKSEHQIQRDAVCTCKRLLKDRGYDPDLLFAIPNGGKRDARTAGAMKMEGVTKGIPDTMLAIPMEPYHGLFIEVKDNKGRLSPEQKKIIPLLREQGYKVEMVRTSEEYIRIVKEYMGWE